MCHIKPLVGLQMISNVIEHPNFINSEDLNFINDSVMSNRFPWYWAERQTTPGFPFLGHTLLSRDDDIRTSDSDVFDFFKGLFRVGRKFKYLKTCTHQDMERNEHPPPERREKPG